MKLPSGREILAATAPVFLATKLEAFYGRGNGDYAHHDMEDIVNLIDGRPSLGTEVNESPEALSRSSPNRRTRFPCDSSTCLSWRGSFLSTV